ncbi:MAG: hypothetical protein NTX61_13255 [Bacteroidetes bacterium]|nr:hypothetical protein [Bacteroidota bacterium]
MKRHVRSILPLSVLLLGFSSLFTQVYLIREFINVFYGNELVMGIVLANWMLLTGFGAWLGRFFPKIRNNKPFILFLQFLFAILPLFTILKLDMWKALAFPYGSMAGLSGVLSAAFFVQLPFCVLNGFLFTAYTSVLSETARDNPVTKVYAWEAIGSVIAGILVNLVFLFFLGTYQSLLILLGLNFIMLLFLTFSMKEKIPKILVSGLISGVCIFTLMFDFQHFTHKLLYPDQKIVFDRSTPFGNLVVTENAGQLNFFENGLALFSSHNEIFSEESVHYGMLQHPHPGHVLLISGGISGTIPEIRKYHPTLIDYVEFNPAILEIGKNDSLFTRDTLLHLFNEDGRRFIRETPEHYDIVLVNIPEPFTILFNRYYSIGFLKDVHSKMNPGGTVSLSLPSTADYVSPTAGLLNSSLYNTLKNVFKNVLIIPGQKNYFLASDSVLSSSIAALAVLRGIDNKFVNPGYLEDDLLKERSDFIVGKIDNKVAVNEDFRPVLCFQQNRYWITYFKENHFILISLVLIVFIMMLLSLNRISFGLFTGGFTGASLEVLILISFQVIYGYVFRMAGVIITLFMAGIALGAFLRKHLYRDVSGKNYSHIQITLAMFCIGFPFIILGLNAVSLPDIFTYGVIALLTLGISLLTGIEFSLASAINEKDFVKNAAKNYSADLFGSATGAILTTTILFPLTGIVVTCLVLAGLNVVSALSQRK